MGLVLVFLLGVANFAMQRAVMESRHPLLGRMPWFYHSLGGRFSLAVEFLLLLSAMLLLADGVGWVAGGYLVYSLLNAIAAWLILTRRV